MRQCPTLEGEGAPLIVQTIGVELCKRRQDEHYHKCHRCVLRGCAAGDEAGPKIRRGHGEGNGVLIPQPPLRQPAAAAGRNGAATPMPAAVPVPVQR